MLHGRPVAINPAAGGAVAASAQKTHTRALSLSVIDKTRTWNMANGCSGTGTRLCAVIILINSSYYKSHGPPAAAGARPAVTYISWSVHQLAIHILFGRKL